MTRQKTWVRIVDPDEPNSPMVWPHPHDPEEIEWVLRYGAPTRSQLLAAASYLNAYKQIFELTQAMRNRRIEQIKAAVVEMEKGNDERS